MKTKLARTLLVLCTLLSMPAIVLADPPGFRDVNGRWTNTPKIYGATPTVQQLAHLSEGSSREEELQDGYGDPFSNDDGNGGNKCCADNGCCSANGRCCDGACGCGDACYCGDSKCCSDGPCCYDGAGCCDYGYQPNAGMYYAEVQLMFLRANVNENVIGKLSEQHELSPRMVLGYEAPSGLGARARYWTYGRTTPNLANAANPLRLDWDVIDVEGTSRFSMGRADLVVAGGFRWADIEVGTANGDAYSEMPGITFAGDLRSAICCGCASQWSAVCGARWSLLAGDWEVGGGQQSLIPAVRDDNMIVHEIYGGIEYCCHHCGYDLYARIVFEVQNWHSDVIAQNTGTDSIGFFGPGGPRRCELLAPIATRLNNQSASHAAPVAAWLSSCAQRLHGKVVISLREMNALSRSERTTILFQLPHYPPSLSIDGRKPSV